MLSRDVLELFGRFLDNLSLSCADPNFEDTAALVVRARREVAEAIANHGPAEGPT